MPSSFSQPLTGSRARMLLRATGIEQYAVAVYRKLVPLHLRLGLRENAFLRRHGSISACVFDVGGKGVRFSAEDSYSRRWLAPYSDDQLHEQPVTLLLLEEMKRSRCFADVGANLGWFSCIAGIHMSDGAVHAFEMDPANYRLLERNLALNGLEGVHAVHAAVTNRPGTVEYRKEVTGAASNISMARESASEASPTITVPAVSLDAYFEGKELLPDLLKIDVEGAELRVLQGMRRLIAERKPRILVEIHPNDLRSIGSSAGEVLEFLTAAGYRLQKVCDVRSGGAAVRLEPVDAHLPPSQNTTYFAT